jgi:hypothetical protein
VAQQALVVAQDEQVVAQEGPTGLTKPEEQLEELQEQLEELSEEEGPKREDFQVSHSGYLIWLSSLYRLQDRIPQ